MREVEVPRVRRNIRTLRHVAHVTEVTVIDDVPVHLLVDGIEFARGCFVDRIEQGGETIAERETTATAVTDIEYALEFFLEGGLVVERGISPVERMTDRRLE
jgi:hypothetical protein